MDGVSELVAGGLGGFACVITGQPFDTIKVKLQTYPGQFKTPLQAFRKTWVQEGFLGMYAGCTPAVVSNIAENAVLFLCYGGCQRAVKWMTGVSSTDDLSVFQQACSGSLASVFSSVAITPPDRVKCILQAQSEQHSGSTGRQAITGRRGPGPWGIVQRILRQEGVQGLFRGLTSTWVREVPGYFFFFGSYSTSKRLLITEQNNSDSNFLRLALAGGMAGAGFWTTVYPVDVVKSRIQVIGDYSGSFWLTGYEILRKEGVRALYKGLSPTIVRAFPANAALFVTFEYTNDFLKYKLGRSSNTAYTDNSS